MRVVIGVVCLLYIGVICLLYIVVVCLLYIGFGVSSFGVVCLHFT